MIRPLVTFFSLTFIPKKKENREGGVRENEVMQLSRSSVGTNVKLYFDNFFTTPLIFKFKEYQIYSLLWYSLSNQERHTQKS